VAVEMEFGVAGKKENKRLKILNASRLITEI
jgi:hypothetical protein